VIRTRIKICGITRQEDAQAAVAAGADALGFVFHEASPRSVTVSTAARIARSVPPFVTLVALFVDARPDLVNAVIADVEPDLLQFHGAETPAACEAYSRPYIKAVRMREDVDLRAVAHEYREARGLLLDSYVPGAAGGTGVAFAWDRIPRDLGKPIVLAGGLTPQNVGEAIAVARPYAVDVSSGVESAPGIKDSKKIAAFIAAVYARGVS
jgi:phosphoribosylanthranilate isomerase